jgi:hypothetical protein
VTVLDPWVALPRGAYDCVVAADVLEHLPDASKSLSDDLLPSLSEGGTLVENSPFARRLRPDLSNPMHHRDFGFDAFMESAGFRSTAATGEGESVRLWSQEPQAG